MFSKHKHFYAIWINFPLVSAFIFLACAALARSVFPAIINKKHKTEKLERGEGACRVAVKCGSLILSSSAPTISSYANCRLCVSTQSFLIIRQLLEDSFPSLGCGLGGSWKCFMKIANICSMFYGKSFENCLLLFLPKAVPRRAAKGEGVTSFLMKFSGKNIFSSLVCSEHSTDFRLFVGRRDPREEGWKNHERQRKIINFPHQYLTGFAGWNTLRGRGWPLIFRKKFIEIRARSENISPTNFPSFFNESSARYRRFTDQWCLISAFDCHPMPSARFESIFALRQ